jgi:hypothetical protein
MMDIDDNVPILTYSKVFKRIMTTLPAELQTPSELETYSDSDSDSEPDEIYLVDKITFAEVYTSQKAFLKHVAFLSNSNPTNAQSQSHDRLSIEVDEDTDVARADMYMSFTFYEKMHHICISDFIYSTDILEEDRYDNISTR